MHSEHCEGCACGVPATVCRDIDKAVDLDTQVHNEGGKHRVLVTKPLPGAERYAAIARNSSRCYACQRQGPSVVQVGF